MKITNEMKTGIVILAALFVVLIFWAKTANFSGSPYKLKTQFSYAEGIKPDSVVKLAGIEIGRVQSIKFIYEPDTRVELELLLDRNAKVHEDSVAYISTSGMVGDAFLGLTSGSPDKPFAKPGAMLVSEDPIEMRKLMKGAEAISANLDKTLTEFKQLASNVNCMVGDNKEKIDSMMSDLETTAVNFKEFSEDIKKHPWKLLSKK